MFQVELILLAQDPAIAAPEEIVDIASAAPAERLVSSEDLLRADPETSQTFDQLGGLPNVSVPALSEPTRAVSLGSARFSVALRPVDKPRGVALTGLTGSDALGSAGHSALPDEQPVTGPSTKLMTVRNPSKVADFMRKRFDDGNLPGEGRAASVKVWIDEWGSVEWAEINQSSGLQGLDEVALQLFNEVVKFQPALEHGTRVSTSAVIWVYFPW